MLRSDDGGDSTQLESLYEDDMMARPKNTLLGIHPGWSNGGNSLGTVLDMTVGIVIIVPFVGKKLKSRGNAV